MRKEKSNRKKHKFVLIGCVVAGKDGWFITNGDRVIKIQPILPIMELV